MSFDVLALTSLVCGSTVQMFYYLQIRTHAL